MFRLRLPFFPAKRHFKAPSGFEPLKDSASVETLEDRARKCVGHVWWCSVNGQAVALTFEELRDVLEQQERATSARTQASAGSGHSQRRDR